MLDTSAAAGGRARLCLACGSGGPSPGSAVTISLEGEQVEAVDVPAPDDAAGACGGAGCQGIVVGPPDVDGRRAMSFNAAMLAAVQCGGLPGDRAIGIGGAFVAPPARSL